MEKEAIFALIRKELHENPVSLSEIKKGRVYLVETEKRKIIFKVSRWAPDEVFFLSKIQQAGIPSPSLLSYGYAEDGQAFFLQEYVSDCQDLLDASLRGQHSFWTQLSEGIKKINAIPVDGFGLNESKEFGKSDFQYETFSAFVSSTLIELEKVLFDTKYFEIITELKKQSIHLREHTQAYLAHGDVGGNNFLWDKKNEKLYFFDPGYFRGMPQTWDIAYFGWRIAEDRVTDEDVNKLTFLLSNNSVSKEDSFEIAFLRALIGCIKIRDGLSSGRNKESYYVATLNHLNMIKSLYSDDTFSPM